MESNSLEIWHRYGSDFCPFSCWWRRGLPLCVLDARAGKALMPDRQWRHVRDAGRGATLVASRVWTLSVTNAQFWNYHDLLNPKSTLIKMAEIKMTGIKLAGMESMEIKLAGIESAGIESA